MTPNERTWLVSDAPFLPNKIHHTETIYTIGNGYMGLRGTFEEGYPDEIVSTLIHGVFNHAEGELVPDLVNLPSPLPILIEVDGEAFHMQRGKVLGYKRTLDLRRATLTREVLWRNSKGHIVKLSFERFSSLERDHLLVQRVTVRALHGNPAITVTAGIDGQQSNMGVKHWASQAAGHDPASQSMHVTGKTTQSGYEVAVVGTLRSHKGTPSYILTGEQRPGLRVSFGLAQGEVVTLDKFSAIHSTRDAQQPLEAARATLHGAQRAGYEALLTAHVAEWATYWENSDVEIDGDEVAQRALRFCTYHVLIAAPRHDERASIGAKTLSGPGYKGHVFWDTELFMVPLLTLTQPKLARNLLMYRYHNLQGARNKAKVGGYKGAMFPWESTDTGEETTPRWTNPDADGKRIRIWTGDSEQHISSDVAYAVLEYWRWTGDDEFFINHGAEIVLDTAVFWASRVEHNAAQDRYELSQQIGPDEYHENVNNSAFTNSLVRWHLRQASGVRDWLQNHYPQQAAALLARLGVDEAAVGQWHTIADKMYVPFDQAQGIYEQFDGFFDLEPLDISHWQPRVANLDSVLGHGPTQKSRYIKQADIVMLMALLGEETGSLDSRKRNWDYYFPLVDHGSSLSPSTHAWVAARLGLTREAYDMFVYAASIDLDDLKGNVRDGIHAAASGGVWEAVVWGFAGLSLDNDTYKFEPNLPDHWRSVKFRFFHKGKQHTVTLTNK
jgi:kojibiose phosphorylase